MSNEFPKGVTFFAKGVLSVPVYFPEGKVKCCYCEYCRAEIDLNRFRCRISNDIIYNPFCEGLPEFCQINMTGEIIGTKRKGVK